MISTFGPPPCAPSPFPFSSAPDVPEVTAALPGAQTRPHKENPTRSELPSVNSPVRARSRANRETACRPEAIPAEFRSGDARDLQIDRNRRRTIDMHAGDRHALLWERDFSIDEDLILSAANR